PVAPALAVGPNKQRRLRRLAEAWLAGKGRGLLIRDIRFDVVGILFDRDGEIAAYDHIENAF
ncbi:MAG: YraN family protein, partial [Actinomycetota bacterium]|nr:YraN family protein [Actinomycetota bacterium]